MAMSIKQSTQLSYSRVLTRGEFPLTMYGVQRNPSVLKAKEYSVTQAVSVRAHIDSLVLHCVATAVIR